MKLKWMMGCKLLYIVVFLLGINATNILCQEHYKAAIYQGEVHFLAQSKANITKIKKYSILSGKYLEVLTYLKESHNYQYDLPWSISNGNYIAIQNSFRPSTGGSAIIKEYEIEKMDSLSLYKKEKYEWDSLITAYGGVKNVVVYFLNVADIDNIGREFIPFSKYLRKTLHSQAYSLDDLVDVRYDFSLFGKEKRKGVIGFKTTSSFEKWEFNLDSISSMKKTFSIVPKIVDSVKYSDSNRYNEVDSSFRVSSFSIYSDGKGNFMIDHISGNIYSIDDSIKYIGSIEFYDDHLMSLEDLDEDCLWVNGETTWKDEDSKRAFIREIDGTYKKVMDKIIGQNRKL